MSVFGIADLHLSFGADKPMDVFKGWENYTDLLYNRWQNTVSPSDTVVIAGDISWGMNLSEALEDFRYMDRLNGRKIILKGNHDYWWSSASKLNSFLEENGLKTICFLHNNCYTVDEYAICGTRGWVCNSQDPGDIKIINREAQRLKTSIEAGLATGKELICFLHFPPAYGGYYIEQIMELLISYKIKRCYFGHLHGHSNYSKVVSEYYDIKFGLISADYLEFKPLRII